MEIIYNKETKTITWYVYNSDGTPMFITKYKNKTLSEAQDFAMEHNYGILEVI